MQTLTQEEPSKGAILILKFKDVGHVCLEENRGVCPNQYAGDGKRSYELEVRNGRLERAINIVQGDLRLQEGSVSRLGRNEERC